MKHIHLSSNDFLRRACAEENFDAVLPQELSENLHPMIHVLPLPQQVKPRKHLVHEGTRLGTDPSLSNQENSTKQKRAFIVHVFSPVGQQKTGSKKPISFFSCSVSSESRLFRIILSAKTTCSTDSFSTPSGFCSSRRDSTCAASYSPTVPSHLGVKTPSNSGTSSPRQLTAVSHRGLQKIDKKSETTQIASFPN